MLTENKCESTYNGDELMYSPAWCSLLNNYFRKLYLKNIASLWHSLARLKDLKCCLNINPRTTLSCYKKESNLYLDQYTHVQKKSLKLSMNIWTKTSQKNLFKNPHHLQDILFCLSLRKIENYTYILTIENLIILLSKTAILFLILMN